MSRSWCRRIALIAVGASLLGAVGELKTLNQDMASQAAALTNAVKGNAKVRGDWGELMLETVLRGPDWAGFLHQMYGNEPPLWSESLRGATRLRVIVNALTRLRFCSAQGVMEFETKDSAGAAPEGFMPWFDVPGRRTAAVPVAFGHWSTLRDVRRDGLLPLDTGCVWGGCLTAARITGVPGQVERISVRCEQASKPGKH